MENISKTKRYFIIILPIIFLLIYVSLLTNWHYRGGLVIHEFVHVAQCYESDTVKPTEIKFYPKDDPETIGYVRCPPISGHYDNTAWRKWVSERQEREKVADSIGDNSVYPIIFLMSIAISLSTYKSIQLL